VLFLGHDNCNIKRRHGYEPLDKPSEDLDLMVRYALVVDVDMGKLRTDQQPRLPQTDFNEKHFLLSHSEKQTFLDWFKLDAHVHCAVVLMSHVLLGLFVNRRQ
jgi:hypothetical protein